MSDRKTNIRLFEDVVPVDQLATNHIDDDLLDDALAFDEYLKLFPQQLDSSKADFLESKLRWRSALSLKKIRNQVDTAYPNRSLSHDGTIGDKKHCPNGTGKSDHCANILDGNVGVVTAIDITHDLAHGCDVDRLSNSVRNSKDERVKYVIWNQQIFSSYDHKDGAAWTWRRYGGHPHDQHMHLSVSGDRSLFDSETDWSVPEKLIQA
ncbi:hypothetical protein N9850_04065 [Granulosicoccus sp.]|nr:hypothetical protein [Granulosicoccus sp.]MDB4222924.1 hypothetical protein [Granulosicoccus sp.]